MTNVLVDDAYLSDIADTIRSKLGVSDTYLPSEMADAIDDIGGGVTPTGTVNITTNGTHDVTQYASAAVAVPNSYSASDEGKVVSNGALVSQTSDTCTENRTVDTTLINSLTVNVSGGGGGGLPSAYQQVEYIDGSATGAVINTGVHPTDDLRAEAKFYPMELTGDALFGTKGASDNADWRLFNYGSEYYLDYGNGNTSGRVRVGPSGAFAINTLYELSIYNVGLFHLDTAKIIGSKTTAVTFSEINYDIFLNGASTSLTTKCKWYYFKLFNGADLVRDFIPCYRKLDNVVGMYDLVNDQFYTSVGSGQFTAGPDV